MTDTDILERLATERAHAHERMQDVDLALASGHSEIVEERR